MFIIVGVVGFIALVFVAHLAYQLYLSSIAEGEVPFETFGDETPSSEPPNGSTDAMKAYPGWNNTDTSSQSSNGTGSGAGVDQNDNGHSGGKDRDQVLVGAVLGTDSSSNGGMLDQVKPIVTLRRDIKLN